MKLKLETKAIIPLGTIKKFMSHINEEELAEDDSDVGDNAEYKFELEIKYPPINYNGDFYWNEMSYHRLTDTMLTWNYNVYNDGGW